MKNQFISLLKQLVFWLLVFAAGRMLFLLFATASIRADGIPFVEVLSTFYHALPLDVSTACYILTLPFLLTAVRMFQPPASWPLKLNRYYTGLVLFIYLLISVAEPLLYAEWETKLSFKALVYLRHPSEVVRSATNSDLVTGVLLLGGLFALFFVLYRLFVETEPGTLRKPSPAVRAGFLLLAPALLLLGIRGGFGEIPITISQSYFSKHNLLNLAAVNSGYNLFFSIIDHYQIEENNRFVTLPDEQARRLVKELHRVERDTTVSVLKLNRPNIVIVLLESWPGDVIESLGGDPGITPRFHELEKEGLLFTRFYTTGNRSQQAMASIYGGLPSLPVSTLADHPEKYGAVPSLLKRLHSEGYFSAFYFGGQLIYGNIKSYLVYNEFDRLVEGSDFKAELPRGKMGVHDEFLFRRFATDLEVMPRPFFATAFTLSSHSPYDQPGDRPFSTDREADFVNSVHYTDRSLGEFFDAVKKKSWYDSTLFVVSSDHSHASYKGYPLRTFEYHNIPFLLLGGALKDEYRVQQTGRIFTNVDLPQTLLHQLRLPAKEFFWSRDMFNPYSPQFAYFDMVIGFGWKRDYGEIVLNFKDNYFYVKRVDKSREQELENEGRAYIQVLMEDFLAW